MLAFLSPYILRKKILDLLNYTSKSSFINKEKTTDLEQCNHMIQQPWT